MNADESDEWLYVDQDELLTLFRQHEATTGKTAAEAWVLFVASMAYDRAFSHRLARRDC